MKAKILAEIERLNNNLWLDDRHDQGVSDGLHAIGKFINSLPEEPEFTIDKDVSQMADEFAEREYEFDGYERKWLSKGYYHGYMDANKSKPEEPVSSLWHNASEKPNGKDYVIAWDGKYASIGHFKEVVNCKWCYLKDTFDKQEESVSEELEEAAKDYFEHAPKDQVHLITDAFKAGAKWDREKIINKAVRWLRLYQGEKLDFLYSESIEAFKQAMED